MRLHLSILVVAAVFSASFVGGAAAEASILPMIVDNTGDDTEYWWSTGSGAPAGAFDERIFGTSGPGWIAPSETTPTGAISTIFRRPDITLNNALSLARLYGASHVLIGDIALEGDDEQPWLGLPRAEVVFRGVVVEVRSGSVVDDLEIRRVSFQPGGSAEAARSVADQARRATDALVQSPGEVGVSDAGPVVVIRSHDGASPFIAVRGALRDVHPGVVDVGEVWATEGQIALALVLDEGVVFEDVARSIDRLSGVAVQGTLVRQVVRTGRGIEIDASLVVPEMDTP